MKSIQFIKDIASNVSWVNDISLEHDLDDLQQGEYYLMYEILLAFIDIANNAFITKENVDENIIKLKIFLNVVENWLNKDSNEVISLISVGFLENITPDMAIFPFVSKIMGNRTSEVLEYTHNPDASIPAIFLNKFISTENSDN